MIEKRTSTVTPVTHPRHTLPSGKNFDLIFKIVFFIVFRMKPSVCLGGRIVEDGQQVPLRYGL